MKFNKLLPIDHRKLLTSLPPKEIKQKLEDLLRNSGYKQNFLFWDTRIRFEGRVLDNSFEISRKPDGGRSILSEIKGQLSIEMGKTVIDMRMRPIMTNRIFMALWMAIIGLIYLGVLFLKTEDLDQSLSGIASLLDWIPFAFFVVGYALTLISFKLERRKMRKFLKQLLEAEEY